jgi:hypothetical protein
MAPKGAKDIHTTAHTRSDIGHRQNRGQSGVGKIRPIRIRIRIHEYSANSNFENDGKIRRIQIQIPTYKFELALANSNSNRIMFPKFANIRREFEFAL